MLHTSDVVHVICRGLQKNRKRSKSMQCCMCDLLIDIDSNTELICRGLRTLFNTLLSSLPAVFNVGSLLFLMFFVYAILGMNLFGTQDNELSQQDSHANFLSFGSSMLTLFRLSTSDSWDQILQVHVCCIHSCTRLFIHSLFENVVQFVPAIWTFIVPVWMSF